MGKLNKVCRCTGVSAEARRGVIRDVGMETTDQNKKYKTMAHVFHKHACYWQSPLWNEIGKELSTPIR